MGGTRNDIIFGEGLDLSGNSTVANRLGTDGFIYIGNSAGNPQAALPTSNDGSINFTAGNGTLDLSVNFDTGFTWNEVTGTTQQLEVDNGYIGNNAGTITMTLPTTASLGDEICFAQKGAGVIKVAQNAGQTIHTTTASTTTGVGGSLSTIDQWSSFCLICVTTDTDWMLKSGSHGSLSVV